MRKKICAVTSVICFIGLWYIPNLFDYEYISFGAALGLTFFMTLGLAASLYGAEAFIFQQEAVKNGKKTH